MLMIIGKYDEYRKRMTGVNDITAEWMSSPQTQQVIPVDRPQLGVTCGSFEQGTARRVFVPTSFTSRPLTAKPPWLRRWSR